MESQIGPGARVSSRQATAIISSAGNLEVGVAASLLEKAGHAIVVLTGVQNAAGLDATSRKGPGIQASGSSIGLDASSSNGIAVRAHSDSGIALQVGGSLQVQGPAVGTVTAQAGQTSLPVQSTAVTPQSIIPLTPLGDPGARLWIDPLAAGMFIIHASQTLPGRLVIHYLIIN